MLNEGQLGEYIDKHRVGWEACLENLEARIFTQATQRI